MYSVIIHLHLKTEYLELCIIVKWTVITYLQEIDAIPFFLVVLCYKQKFICDERTFLSSLRNYIWVETNLHYLKKEHFNQISKI